MNYAQFRSHRLESQFQALVLMLGMALIMSVVGYSLGGRTGVWLAIGVSFASLLFGTSASPRVMLQMFRARPIDPQKIPELHEMFGDLVRRAGLPHQPALYYVPTPLLNAFAVGTDRDAAVAVTDGLLRTMTKRELAGILAHELSHLRFGDTQLMALGQVFSRLTATMSQIGQLLLLISLPAALMGSPFISLGGLLVLIFAPIACVLLQLALSRSREFNADLGAIEITGDPTGLANGTRKARTHRVGRLAAPHLDALSLARVQRAPHPPGHRSARHTPAATGRRFLGISLRRPATRHAPSSTNALVAPFRPAHRPRRTSIAASWLLGASLSIRHQRMASRVAQEAPSRATVLPKWHHCRSARSWPTRLKIFSASYLRPAA